MLKNPIRVVSYRNLGELVVLFLSLSAPYVSSERAGHEGVVEERDDREVAFEAHVEHTHHRG